MRFMMMIKSNATSEAGVPPDAKLLAEMGAFNETLTKAGAMLGGEGLHASSKGSRVHLSGKKFSVIDGPFAEAKELIAGYWTIRATDKAEAIEWAKRVPMRDGEIELRQVYELEDFPVDPAEQPEGWRDREQHFRDATEAPGAVQPPRKPGTKRFMVLIKSDKNTESGVLPSEAGLAKMGELLDEAVKSGILLGGDGLFPSAAGARVLARGGKRSVVDGPFTEAKEMIAGYSTIEAKTKEEAVAWAKRMLQIHVDYTDSTEGEVEVRQLIEPEDFAIEAAEKPDGVRQREQAPRERLGHR